MGYSTKNKLLIMLLFLLVLANIATITVFWLSKGKHPALPAQGRPQPADYLITQLGFDSTQKTAFMELVQQHRAQTETLRQQVKTAKANFFRLLQQPAITDSEKKTAAKNISLATEQLDLITFDHFKKIRALCNPEQQKKFDSVIQDVLRMNAGAQGPGPRGHGRPKGPPPPGEREDGPPPPGDEKQPPPSH